VHSTLTNLQFAEIVRPNNFQTLQILININEEETPVVYKASP